MDSYLADLSFGFIKKFDHFLPVLLHNRALLLNNEGTSFMVEVSPLISAII